MKRRIATMVLAFVVITGSACSSGRRAAERSSTSTTPSFIESETGADPIDSPTAPPPPADDTDAVEAAYFQFWAVVGEYGKRTGRFNPVDAKAVLGAVATDGEYRHLFDVFQLNRLKGLVFRDGVAPDELAPLITVESPTRASVKDCRTDEGGIYMESGERVDTPTEGRRLFEVILVKDDSQWKVSSVGGRTDPEDPLCTV